MADVPVDLPTGRVVGRFIVEVQDNDDPGEEPQLVPATGEVLIKSSIDHLQIFDPTLGDFITFRGPHKGVIDNDGFLSTPYEDSNAPNYTGMTLWSNDSDKLSVKGWTYTATFNLKTIDGKALNLPAVTFELATGQILDLAKVIRVPSSPGYGLPQAEAAALRAEAAVYETITGATVVDDDLQMTRRNGDTFIAGHVRGETGAPGPKGDPGPSGVSNTDQFYQISEAAGRTVSVWDYLNDREQLIYGDTGARSLVVPNVEPLNGVGTVTIRRVGNEVTLILDRVEYIGTDARGYLTDPGFIPIGFRPRYSENPTGIILNVNANSTYPISILQATRIRRMGPALVGNEPGLALDAFRGTLRWNTTEPWPATLPGVAA